MIIRYTPGNMLGEIYLYSFNFFFLSDCLFSINAICPINNITNCLVFIVSDYSCHQLRLTCRLCIALSGYSNRFKPHCTVLGGGFVQQNLYNIH